jgi:hypothetical protein
MPWSLTLKISRISWGCAKLISSVPATSSMSDENRLLEGVSCSYERSNEGSLYR